jgi:hypothetical protein
MPATAGIQYFVRVRFFLHSEAVEYWVPAFAATTPNVLPR